MNYFTWQVVGLSVRRTTKADHLVALPVHSKWMLLCWMSFVTDR